MTRLITLVALIGFSWVLGLVDSAAPTGAHAAMLLGFVLLASYLAGQLAARLSLPRVSGYVLLGVAVGPFALGILSVEMAGALRTIDELALALIALTAGGELKIPAIRRMLRSIVALSVGVMIVVLVGIVALMLAARPLVPFLAGEPWGLAVAFALLLGVWCANSSPDVTVAVINESGARGPLTDTILSVTIFKDVLVIISFALALSVARVLVEPGASFDAALVGAIGWEVGGAFLIGGLAGMGFGFYLKQVRRRNVLATLVFAYALIVLAHGLHVELLLTAVGAGFVIENFSPVGDELIDAIESNSLVIYAIFFAIAGAALDLGALATYWPIAAAVVAARTVLTWAGARMGGRLGATEPAVRDVAWLGLISQAGVTLGLSLLVGREFPGWGDRFVAVTAAIIILHLLLGPVLLKLALARAGETPGAGKADADAGVTATPAPALESGR